MLNILVFDSRDWYNGWIIFDWEHFSPGIISELEAYKKATIKAD